MVTKYDNNQKVEYFGMGLEAYTVRQNDASALHILKAAVDRCYDEDVLYDGEVQAAADHLRKGMTRKVLADNLLKAFEVPYSEDRQRAAIAAFASMVRNL